MQRLFFLAGILVLPLGVLLFLQWPLREWVPGAASRMANDAGQIVFALYLAVAMACATLRGQNVHARGRWNARARTKAVATLLLVAPWGVFMLWRSVPAAMQSATEWERFAETLNPGYFLIRMALVLLPVLLLLALLQRARQKAPRGD